MNSISQKVKILSSGVASCAWKGSFLGSQVRAAVFVLFCIFLSCFSVLLQLFEAIYISEAAKVYTDDVAASNNRLDIVNLGFCLSC